MIPRHNVRGSSRCDVFLTVTSFDPTAFVVPLSVHYRHTIRVFKAYFMLVSVIVTAIVDMLMVGGYVGVTNAFHSEQSNDMLSWTSEIISRISCGGGS